ncbi:radical SAM protein [Desulfobacula sp.]|uniref:B12-binding domain-containing radical SAM protein n=1 Tax=Desulfobacula sp. TaxID=2593537 RepID=UPI002624278C|nr:radical SAM protein [Desulfobacula sp.]
MRKKYYIVYNPVTYNLMESIGKCQTPLDLLSDITNKDAAQLNQENYLGYLDFDTRKEKLGMVETFAIESYSIIYVANQVAKFDPNARVILSDGIRTRIQDIIRKNGKPAGVFISAMSSNFPTAVCTGIALNHGGIPVVLGGIHVSSSGQDVDIFIKQHVPNPELVSHVRGGADSDVMGPLIRDLNKGTLAQSYTGYKMVEDKVWGHENIEFMPPMRMELLRRLPIVGNALADKIRVNPTAPYLGCPYSCSFCSISSLPKDLRQFTMRTPEDLINEIEYIQRQGVNLQTRLFFFLADNIILGGKRLEEILDLLLERRTKINYMVQVSIEIADNNRLLKKLRLSGASHLFIGFESLDIRDLKFIGKNVVKDIEASHKSVAEYYSERIKKIQRHGMTIHGSFILGLPHDYFNSIHDNTGHDYGRFCLEHHIGVQATPLSDLPGSRDFIQTQKNKTYLFGKNGTMDYLIALVICDLTEGNRIPNESVRKSPLVLLHMAFETINCLGKTRYTFRNAFYMMVKSFLYPTANGRRSFLTRLNDALVGFTVPLLVSLYKDHADKVLSSTPHARGAFERLYDMEKNPAIKREFRAYVNEFVHR